MNPRKASCMQIRRVREFYPHLIFSQKQTFGGPKASQWGGMIQEDLKYLKISLSKNHMKPMPSQCAHLIESITVFGLSNRFRMKKLCPSEVFEEHKKML